MVVVVVVKATTTMLRTAAAVAGGAERNHAKGAGVCLGVLDFSEEQFVDVLVCAREMEQFLLDTLLLGPQDFDPSFIL